MQPLTVSRVLVLIAFVLLVLVALSVEVAGFGGLPLLALGLAFWCAPQLVP